MRTPLYLLLLLLATSCREVVLRVSKLPSNTPRKTVLFVGGDFNHWDPADQNFRLTQEPDGAYYTTLPWGVGKTGYKFTRGDWTSVETDRCGHEISDRLTDYFDSPDTVDILIDSWKDLGPTNCNRVVLRIKKIPAETPHDAKIYLASNYDDWMADWDGFLFREQPDGTLQLTVEPKAEPLLFKLTRGSWSSEAVDAEGNVRQNEMVELGHKDTVDLTIDAWKDIDPGLMPGTRTLLVKVPRATPADADLYVAGNFNGWVPNDPDFKMKRLQPYVYGITLNKGAGPMEFKFTRGTWDKEELDEYRAPIDNRRMRQGPGKVELTVEAWKDIIGPRPDDMLDPPDAPIAPVAPLSREEQRKIDDQLAVMQQEIRKMNLEAKSSAKAESALNDRIRDHVKEIRKATGGKSVVIIKNSDDAQPGSKGKGQPDELADIGVPDDGYRTPVKFPMPKGAEPVVILVSDEEPYNRKIFVQLELPDSEKGKVFGFTQQVGRRTFKAVVPFGTRVFACDGPYWNAAPYNRRLVATADKAVVKLKASELKY